VLLREGAKGALEKLSELVRVSGVPATMVGWSIVDIMRKVHDAARLLEQGQQEFAAAKQLRLWGDSQAVVMRAARQAGSRRAAAALDTSMRACARTRTGLSGDEIRTYESLIVTLNGGAR
jgi:DNA polymerase III delta subunit